MQLLVATFRHMKNKNQLLVIPITIWSGIEQGFFGADFTAVSENSNKTSSTDLKLYCDRVL